jgi:amyloid beta precursor protein binding protein 1
MDVPTEKTAKYDRQLRLWGDHGQSLLESSRVCLVNATATGTEILKNLVLPGIGAFTVVDGAVVTAADLGANFFVSNDEVGESRSQVTVSLLQELNKDVKGNFIDEDFETVLGNDTNFFSKFTLVIASDLCETSLLKLSEVLWKSCTPLVVASSYGLLGYIRIAVPIHEIYESHPDNFHDDLRLDRPFQELIEYMDKINLADMDSSQRGNVPYLVILFKCLEKWKSIHDKFPSNYKEKKEFKQMIQLEIDSNGSVSEGDNIEEAIKNVNQKIVATKTPLDVHNILEDQLCTNINPDSTTFWILARAIREFVHSEGGGFLPLRGSIPDMTSSSDLYVQLQRVYQARANKDVDAVMSHVQQVLSSLGRVNGSITKKKVKEFCKNSAFLNVFRYRSISEEHNNLKLEPLRSLLDDPNNDIIYYILLRAAEKYFILYHCSPGEKQDTLESDVAHMRSIVLDFLSNNGLTCTISDDHITEFCRYGGKEIHSVAAYVGGVASQEIIKLITHQYVPLNNTLIYHAGSSKTVTIVL